MRGNPRPIQTEVFKAKRFQPVGEVDQPLAGRVTSIRLPVDVDTVLWSMDKEDRITWLRNVITQAARRELMGQPTQDAQETQLTGEKIEPSPSQDEPPAKGARRGRKRRGGIEGQSTLFEEQP